MTIKSFPKYVCNMPEIEVSFPDIFQGFILANIAKNQVDVDIHGNKLMPGSGPVTRAVRCNKGAGERSDLAYV